MKKGIAVVFLAIICTFLFYGIRYMKSPLLTQKAVYGTYEESVDTDCFFVREETVYNAGISGIAYNNFSDGMRVNNNSVISTVYTGKINDETIQKLNTIDKKIEELRDMSVSGIMAYENDSSNVENKIDTYKYDLISAAVDDNIYLVSRYKNAINNLRNGSSTMSPEEQIEILESEKIAAESEIGGKKQEIVAEISGVFSSVLDGMEHILTPERVKEFSVQDFEKLSEPSEKTANITVNAGDSICKLVNNHKWYVVCTLAEERLSKLNKDMSVSMRFDNIPGVDVAGKVIYISEPYNGKCVVVTESNQYVESAYSMRKSSMEMIFKSYSGYKIPIYAVRTNENGVKGVLARRNNIEKFYPCKILYTNDSAEYVIVGTDPDSEVRLDNIDEIVLGER